MLMGSSSTCAVTRRAASGRDIRRCKEFALKVILGLELLKHCVRNLRTLEHFEAKRDVWCRKFHHQMG